MVCFSACADITTLLKPPCHLSRRHYSCKFRRAVTLSSSDHCAGIQALSGRSCNGETHKSYAVGLARFPLDHIAQVPGTQSSARSNMVGLPSLMSAGFGGKWHWLCRSCGQPSTTCLRTVFRCTSLVQDSWNWRSAGTLQ